MGENNSRIFQEIDMAALAEHFRSMHNNPLARDKFVFTLGVESSIKKQIKNPHVVDEPLSSKDHQNNEWLLTLCILSSHLKRS